MSTHTPAATEQPPARVIRPVKRRVSVADLWRSWRVARVLAGRDLKIKYKQSLVGPPWLVLQPLGILGGLVVAFNGVANVETGGKPYLVFGLVGLIIWTLVQMTILNGTLTMVANAQLIRRTACPRIAFLTGNLASNLVGPAVILVATLVLLIGTGEGLPTQALLLPLLLAWATVVALGLLMILASLTVRFRDVNTLLPFWSQAGLFVTPVGFSYFSAPGKVQDVLALNPLTGLLELARWCLLDIQLDMWPVITAAVWTAVIVAGGWLVFTRMETRFADYV